MTFGLITEGPTDQVVLRTILQRYVDVNADIRTLQPNTDATDGERNGGWTRIQDYCKSETMKAMLEMEDIDHAVIQIDTDVCEDYNVPKRENGADLSAEEIINRTKAVIISWMGDELYRQYSEKIIFAISYNSIECWLLPLYFTDNRRTKTVSCCETLNTELIKQKDFTIDCGDGKKPKYYEKMSRDIKNRKQLDSVSSHNISFSLFINALQPMIKE